MPVYNLPPKILCRVVNVSLKRIHMFYMFTKAKGPEPEVKQVPPTEPVKLPTANPVNEIPPAIPAMACYGPSYDGFGGRTPWYNGFGAIPSQKQMLKKGFKLSASSGDRFLAEFLTSSEKTILSLLVIGEERP